MEIDLEPATLAALELVAEKTLLPIAELAGAFVAAGLLGWAHPVVISFWQPVIQSGRWPVMGGN